MFKAIDAKGNEINTKDVRNVHSDYFCPCCNGKLVLKNQYTRKDETFVRSHFAHLSGLHKNCDEWYDVKNQMSQWHIDMQNIFDTKEQEIIIEINGKKRFTDVKHGDRIIEFQHSSMSHNEFIARTKCYSKENILIWVFDMQNKISKPKKYYKLKQNDMNRFVTIQKAKYNGSTITDDNLLCVRNLKLGEEDNIVCYFYLIFQISKEDFLLVNFYNDEGYCNGKILSYNEFVSFMKDEPLTFKKQEIIDKDEKCVNHKFALNEEQKIERINDEYYKCYNIRTKQSCKLCNCRRIIITDEKHTFKKHVFPSTCSKKGKIINICENCNKEVFLEKLDIDKNNHVFSEPIVSKKSTCSSEGELTYTCIYCGFQKKEQININPNEHNFILIDQRSATCTKSGEETFECECCKQIKKHSIPTIPHKWNFTKVESTCINEGYEGEECECCKKIYQKKILPKKPHNKTNIKNIIETTCEKDGLYEFYCAQCNLEYYCPVYATGHSWRTEWFDDPKLCRESVCTKCGSHKDIYYHNFNKNNQCNCCGRNKDT